MRAERVYNCKLAWINSADKNKKMLKKKKIIRVKSDEGAYVFFMRAFSAYRFLANILPLIPSACQKWKMEGGKNENFLIEELEKHRGRKQKRGEYRRYLLGKLGALVNFTSFLLAFALEVVMAVAMSLPVKLNIISLWLHK